MRDMLHRLRVPLLFGTILLLSLVSMHTDRRARAAGSGELGFARGLVLDIAVPIQKMIAAPVDLVRDTWQRYVALVDLQHENDALRAQLAALREENLQYREALVASGRLRRIAEMRDDFELPMLAMEVVGQDAIVQRSRARGIVRGRGGDRLEFEFVVGGADVQLGDVVISSGLDGVYPKGLRVGEVEDLVASSYGLTQRAILKPAVDFGRLEQVFVVLWRAPTMELLYDDAAVSPPGS